MIRVTKKAVCSALACIMLLSSAAMAKENKYAYNKFISTLIGPTDGYCDFAKSFTGHEAEYDDVNAYFSGLISAFYDDIDADFDNELVTVESKGITFYRTGEKIVEYLGEVNEDLIANYGDSYANVFTVKVGKRQFVGLEKYGKTANEYNMFFYEADPETDEINTILKITHEDNEDGKNDNVWAGGKSFYSYTTFGGGTATMNPDNYESVTEAAAAAIKAIAPDSGLDAELLDKRMNGNIEGDDFKLEASGIVLKTYVRATGLRLTDTPMVYFEDKTQLEELKKTVDIIPVYIDGARMQFQYYLDPVIMNDVTMVPMRTIFEYLGAEVEWQEVDGVQTVTAAADGTSVVFTIGSEKYYVNGEERVFDTPAQLMDDTTFVQLRAVSESFGCNVDWNGESRTVIIKTLKEEPEEIEQPTETETQTEEVTEEEGSAAAEETADEQGSDAEAQSAEEPDNAEISE